MREILFRGKQIDNDKWFEGYLSETTIISDNTYVAFVIYKKPKGYYDSECSEVIPETVGQYTGLTDKNGKKIFEGDILRQGYHPEDDVAVLWHDGRFCFKKVKKINKDYPFESECCIQNAVKWLKVIGNVHDNPELLKEAEQK